MPRLSQTLVSHCVAFLITSTLIGGMQTLLVAEEQRKDAAAILTKAAGLVDLQTQGATPFLMLANVVLHEGNKSVEGVFAMTWAAPGQYRRVYRFSTFTSTEVVTQGAIYRERSTKALPLAIWELDQLLALASNYRPSPGLKVSHIQGARSGDTELTCVMVQSSVTNASSVTRSSSVTTSNLCVNAVTGYPFSIDQGSDVRDLDRHERFEFSDYQPFEGRTFPRKLTFRGWGTLSVEVQVQKLVRVQSFRDDEFKPSPAATMTSFCESPETAGEVRGSAPGTIPIGFQDVEVDMYFQVSPEGGVRYAQVVHSSDPVHNKEILNWFIGMPFPVKTCSGKPIAYETMVRFKTGH